MRKEETSGEKIIGTLKVQEKVQNGISYGKTGELPEYLGGGIPCISFRDSCPPCCHLSLQEKHEKITFYYFLPFLASSSPNFILKLLL